MDITTRVLASYYESYIILYSMHTTLESSISMHIIILCIVRSYARYTYY